MQNSNEIGKGQKYPRLGRWGQTHSEGGGEGGNESNKIKNSTSDINLPVDVKDKKHKTFHRDGENVIETLLIKREKKKRREGGEA